ncbi:carbohydrate ABC transporter permease [Microbacterium sp. A84]|uniref:carbohydrate ABC transporter permease n=1 Tax=Microbacterium sp. A84 TaxID=3450715 RepID=UPI003F4362B0
MIGKERRGSRALRLAFVGILVICAGFPIYWMLNTGLSENSELYGEGQSWFPHLERIGNLGDFLEGIPILKWLMNSSIIAFGITLLSLVFSVFAAYALSRFRFRGKGVAGFLLFVTQMMPEALLIVPLYALFTSLGLLNNLFGLVLAHTAFVMPVATFILKAAIDKVPYEIEESARVDGAKRMGVISLVVFPLILPSVAAAAVMSFFDGWNEFLFANTFISDPSLWPASVGLASFIGQFVTPINGVMLSALAFSIPAIVFFLLMQRQIVAGLSAGSVKG